MKYGDFTFHYAAGALTRVGRTFAQIIPHATCDAGEAPSRLFRLVYEWRTKHRLLISRDHCGATIYPEPADNVAARVWHDWRHFTTRGEFDAEGENATFLAQCTDILAMVPGVATQRAAIHLLRCEVLGQLEYLERTGEFPPDQREFTAQWLIENPMEGN